MQSLIYNALTYVIYDTEWIKYGFPEWIMIIPKYIILDSKGSYNHQPTRATTAHLEEGSTSNWRNSAQTDWPGPKMTSILGTNIVLGCFGFICWPATTTNQGYLFMQQPDPVTL